MDQNNMFNGQVNNQNDIPKFDVDNNSNIFGVQYNQSNQYQQPSNMSPNNYGQINNQGNFNQMNNQSSFNQANNQNSDQLNNNQVQQPISFEKKEVEESPKYGYASNNNANLNHDENSGIKFIVILAILMLLVIVFLPYLSNLI